MIERIKSYREDLHRIAELSLEEHRTKKYLKDALKTMGFSPIDILETGVLVYIDANAEETIAFRSDMDALPIHEKNCVPYKSETPGVMHACGHDGHMAALLGFAYELSQTTNKFKKNILLIFQPAEETIGGAKLIVKAGILEKYRVKAIFGLHLFPMLEFGKIGCRAKEFMAKASEINVDIVGKSAHGAMPQRGIDANIIAAKFLLDMQTIITREISPLDSSVITFGKIRGGDTRNIIPENARLEGTIRTFSIELFDFIVTRIHAIAKGYEIAHNVKIHIDINEGYPPVLNDSKLYEEFLKAMEKFDYEAFEKPFMLAEDFSYYQEAVPGVFFFLGTKDAEFSAPLHSAEFDFNSTVLNRGVEAYKELLSVLEVI